MPEELQETVVRGPDDQIRVEPLCALGAGSYHEFRQRIRGGTGDGFYCVHCLYIVRTEPERRALRMTILGDGRSPDERFVTYEAVRQAGSA